MSDEEDWCDGEEEAVWHYRNVVAGSCRWIQLLRREDAVVERLRLTGIVSPYAFCPGVQYPALKILSVYLCQDVRESEAA